VKTPDRVDDGFPEDAMRPNSRMEFKLRANYCSEFRKQRRKEYPCGLLQALDPLDRPSTIGMYDIHADNRKVTNPAVDHFEVYTSAFKTEDNE
jgi:hypothetical protein